MLSRISLLGATALVAATALTAPDAAAQTAELQHFTVPFVHDTGPVEATGTQREIVASFTVAVPTADWMRLYFDVAELAGDPKVGNGTQIRITSHLDGDFQLLDAISMQQWRLSSCYLNGDAVQVDVIAYPGTGPSRIVMSEVDTSAPPIESQCGSVDNRTPSSDARAARLLPVGCTGWMIDDCNHCFLTAGHCSTSASSIQVVQFNVPASNSNGSLNHPPASDQYPADTASRQSNGGQGVGDDWAYFGAFSNSNTGLTPAAAQGAWYTLAAPGSGTPGDIRITGYGTDSTPSTRNQVQQTHAGPWVVNSGTHLGYQADTTGGNSGSPVILESTGEAIGIHAHGGCSTSGGGYNSGTSITHSAIQNALANPLGVCACTAQDDTYEDNDDCASAVALPTGTTTGLVAVGADQDYFSIDVDPGGTLTADVLFSHANGDIDVRLWDATCANQLDISQSASDDEQVSYTNTTASTATLKLQVYVYQGAGTNGYDVVLDVAGGTGCFLPDDMYEDNDDCGQEVALTNGLHTGLMVSKTDWDYYALSVANGDTLDISLSFTHANGDIDAFLYEAGSCADFAAGDVGCNGSLACGYSGSDNESVVYTNTTGLTQNVVLKVNVYPSTTTGECNDYTLIVTGAGSGAVGTPYCAANPNSTGTLGAISAEGSNVVADNDFTLHASGLPVGQFGFFVCSRTSTFVPFVGGSQGNLCVGPSIGRAVGDAIYNTGLTGNVAVAADLGAMPEPNGHTAVLPGETWYFQGWHRDLIFGTPTSNFTNGLEVTFE